MRLITPVISWFMDISDLMCVKENKKTKSEKAEPTPGKSLTQHFRGIHFFLNLNFLNLKYLFFWRGVGRWERKNLKKKIPMSFK